MPSKKPLYYKQLYLLIFRNVGWIGILSFLVLFFAVPMHLVLLDKKDYREWGNNLVFQQIFDVIPEIQMGVLLLIPILLGIFLFRYIQNKAFSDLMHSLPVSRKFLFHFFTWNGFVVLILPIVLNGLILMAAYSLFDLEIFFSIKSIFSWMGIFTVYTSIIYFACIFVGMLTGLSITQGVFTALFLLFPAAAIFMLFYNFSNYVQGFPVDIYLSDKIMYLSPIMVPAIIYDSNYSEAKVAIAYIVASVIFYVAALFLYKRRNTETVYQTLTIRNLRGLFKYTVTICFMLLAGLYFQVMNNGIAFHLFGLLIGSFIGYLIGEMFIQKSWRVFNRLKGYVFFLIAAALVAGVSPLLINKYEQYVPKVGEIRSVTINDIFFNTDDDMEGLTSVESKMLVADLHKDLIGIGKVDEDTSLTQITIEYRLNDNSEVTRTYSIGESAYRKLLKPIYESKEYKQKLYTFKSSDIKKVTVEMPYDGGSINISDEKELNSFLSVLTEDKLNESFEEMTKRYASTASIDIQRKNGSTEYLYSFISEMNRNTIEWLKKRGYQNGVTLNPETIEKMYIFNANEIGISQNFDYSPDNIEAKVNKISAKIEVDNKELQKEIISNYVYSEEKYAVYVKSKYQYNNDLSFMSQEDLPEGIKEKLEK